MDRAEYEAAICKELPGARLVAFKKVSLGEWAPVENECHKNVDRWIGARPVYGAVRGWVFYKECLIGGAIGLELTAHSVVGDEAGDLFDITPVHDERQRPFMLFVPHVGDEARFWELEREHRFICCPTCPAER